MHGALEGRHGDGRGTEGGSRLRGEPDPRVTKGLENCSLRGGVCKGGLRNRREVADNKGRELAARDKAATPSTQSREIAGGLWGSGEFCEKGTRALPYVHPLLMGLKARGGLVRKHSCSVLLPGCYRRREGQGIPRV